MRLFLRSGILLEPPFPEYFPFINTGVDDPNSRILRSRRRSARNRQQAVGPVGEIPVARALR